MFLWTRHLDLLQVRVTSPSHLTIRTASRVLCSGTVPVKISRSNSSKVSQKCSEEIENGSSVDNKTCYPQVTEGGSNPADPEETHYASPKANKRLSFKHTSRKISTFGNQDSWKCHHRWYDIPHNRRTILCNFSNASTLPGPVFHHT